MITLLKHEAIEYLKELDGRNYAAMTNEELTEEFCLSGLFSHHFPTGYENDFEVI